MNLIFFLKLVSSKQDFRRKLNSIMSKFSIINLKTKRKLLIGGSSWKALSNEEKEEGSKLVENYD